MKKFTLFAGILFMTSGAFAADPAIQVASTNRVRNSVYDITYGNPNENLSSSGATNDYGYRHGVVPQNAKLDNIEGATVASVSAVTDTPNITSVPVGSLPATAGTETIKANKANIATLKRDKLSTAATGNCDSNHECGYVTTGDHINAPVGTTGGGGRTWMKIVTASDI